MRIVIITDSLGCPREEINVNDTWTDKILKQWSGYQSNSFYTVCSRGLSSKDVSLEYIALLKPDLIICQIGIVDACRRALSRTEQAIISRIPGLGNIVKGFCSKHHLQITKMREEGSQFIIATHSPILLGLPDASIYSFDNGEVRLCKYEDTECYKVMKLFINNREVFLNRLLNG